MAWNKYQQQKKQVTTDGGLTWNDVIPYEYRKGSLLEANSTDCTPSNPDCDIQYKWVDVPTSEETMCWDGNEWSIQKKYYSRDCGLTWTFSGVKQSYQMVTPNSECCDGNTYICGEPVPPTPSEYCEPTSINSCNATQYGTSPVTEIERESTNNDNYTEIALVNGDGIYGFNGLNGNITKISSVYYNPSSVCNEPYYIGNNNIYTTYKTSSTIRFMRQSFDGTTQTFVICDLTVNSYLQSISYPINETTYILVTCNQGRDLRTAIFNIYRYTVNFDTNTATPTLIYTLTVDVSATGRCGWTSSFAVKTNKIYLSISNTEDEKYYLTIYEVDLTNNSASLLNKCRTTERTSTYSGGINKTNKVLASYPTNSGFINYDVDDNITYSITYPYDMDCYNGYIWYSPCNLIEYLSQ